jgi:hypothetical protein
MAYVDVSDNESEGSSYDGGPMWRLIHRICLAAERLGASSRSIERWSSNYRDDWMFHLGSKSISENDQLCPSLVYKALGLKESKYQAYDFLFRTPSALVVSYAGLTVRLIIDYLAYRVFAFGNSPLHLRFSELKRFAHDESFVEDVRRCVNRIPMMDKEWAEMLAFLHRRPFGFCPVPPVSEQWLLLPF